MTNKLDIGNKEIRKSHYQELVKWKYKDKIFWAKKRIKEFIKACEEDHVPEITISFSGGKDSTVLLDLVLKVHSEIKSKIPLVPVYATEVTFPSTYKYIKETVRHYQKQYPLLKNEYIAMPKKTWNEILSEHGYPIFSKQVSTLINRVKKNKTQNSLTKWFFGIDRKKTSTSRYMLARNRLFLLDDNMLNNWDQLIRKDKEMKAYFKKYNDPYFFSEKCCDFIKGNLKHDNRPSFIGTMAQESELRKKSWINDGCNIYSSKKKKSRPLSIWSENDIWQYLKENKIKVNEAYNFDINKDLDKQNLRFTRLGCCSCPYGSYIEQKKIDILEKRRKNNQDSNIKINEYMLLNRFEKLKKDYPNQYNGQIIFNGMYKVLIDMGIKIKNDELYMKLFKRRWKDINDWYSEDNFRTNILRVMCQIENPGDYKKKGKGYTWEYTIKEFNQAMEFFGFEKTNREEISNIRDKTKNDFISKL